MAKSLNGYWISNENPDVTVFVEKVYKKGTVTGFKYTKIRQGEVIGEFKATHEELQRDYTQKKYE